LREDLRVELTRLQRTLGVTAVYVTHDQSEALAMSSSVAVMKDGVVQQFGTPEALYDYPRTRFVASFLGAANLVEARVLSVGKGEAEHGKELFAFDLETGWGARFKAFGPVEFAVGRHVSAAVRPEGIRLVASANGGQPNLWTGAVESVQFLGDAVDYRVKVREHLLRSRCDRSQHFRVGETVALEVRSKACTVLVD
jgi:iron(III) transport system ATP-binding protein